MPLPSPEPEYLRLAPRQCRLVWLHRGAMLVALDGDVCIASRDTALAAFGDAAPLVQRTLHEGERLTIEQAGVVSITTPSTHAVQLIVMPARAHPAVLLARRWLGGAVGLFAKPLRRRQT